MKTAQMKICSRGSTQGPRYNYSQQHEPGTRSPHWLHLLTLFIALCSYGTSNNLSAADSLAAADTVFRFQSKMAQRGHVASQYALAYMYESGQGTDKDLALATEWYRQAAQQGFVPAQDRLVYIEILNNGFQRQQQQAWLLKLKQTADDYNHQHQGESAFLLAQLYAEGLAVNKSLTMALKYFHLAEAANVIGSDSEIRRVEAELDALRQTYMPADSGTSQKALQPDKPAADNKPAATAKPTSTINKATGATASQPAAKTNKRAEVKPADTRTPQPHRQTKTTDTHKAGTGPTAASTTQAASTNSTTTTRTQAAPAADKSNKADKEEPHPMDLICSGWQRLNSACR
jgi:hypothetical protein